MIYNVNKLLDSHLNLLRKLMLRLRLLKDKSKNKDKCVRPSFVQRHKENSSKSLSLRLSLCSDENQVDWKPK